MIDKKTQRDFLKIIKRPIITDKTTRLLENNQYCFHVNYKINKLIIKQAVEYIFNVQVVKINTCHLPKKKRKIGRFQGYKPHYKKAIVKLSPNDRINLFLEQ